MLYSSTQQVIAPHHMCQFLKASKYSNVQLYQLFRLHPIRADGFPFPSIYGLPYPTFHFHLVLLPSHLLFALLLIGDLSRLCIFFLNCKGWSKYRLWSCWIPLVAWLGRYISRELNHLWILSWCHIMDYIYSGSFQLFLWHRADILWWVFGYCPLSSYPGFLEPMLCALGCCYDHPYTLKKRIVRCFQHWAKTIIYDTDAFQEKMISLKTQPPSRQHLFFSWQ